MASQAVAGVGVEDAAAQEGGADQDVENVKHGDAPGSAANAPHAVGMLRRTPIGPAVIKIRYGAERWVV
jgi:hypothetical protein